MKKKNNVVRQLGYTRLFQVAICIHIPHPLISCMGKKNSRAIFNLNALKGGG